MMPLRYADTCGACGRTLPAGTQAGYDRNSRKVTCVVCLPLGLDDPAFASGTAGASAQREHDRRAKRHEKRLRAAHPELGNEPLTGREPRHIAAWQTGARGEEILGAQLDKLKLQGVQTLHDRRIPGTKYNIDHIAIGPRGIYVIDAKKYKGMVRKQLNGLFWTRTEKLIVGRRNQTKLAAGVKWQISHVESALESAGITGIPVFGMLCFVEGNWPLFSSSFAIDGIEVLWPKAASKQVVSPGFLGADQAQALHRVLALSLPSA